MRTLLFSLAACAALLLAPEAQAQRGASSQEASGEVVEAWYRITAGDRTEMVRARAIQTTGRGGQYSVEANGRRVMTGRTVSVEFVGVVDLSRPDDPPMEAQSGGKTPVSWSTTVIQSGDKGTTISASSSKTNEDGSTTTTKTTTSTSESGGVSSKTETKTNPPPSN